MTTSNAHYPRYVEHQGKRHRVDSPSIHAGLIGHPVNDDGTLVEEPVAPEDAMAALYPPTNEQPDPQPDPDAPDGADLVTAAPTKWAQPKRK